MHVILSSQLLFCHAFNALHSSNKKKDSSKMHKNRVIMIQTFYLLIYFTLTYNKKQY